jgi:hypothetical protein
MNLSKNFVPLFGVFCTKHVLFTLLKIGLIVVYYVTIVHIEEKKGTGHFFSLISRVKNDLKITSYYTA